MERGHAGGELPSTLLGPEEAAASRGRLLVRLGSDSPWTGGGGHSFRPYLENCIVDASIFFFV